MAEKKWPPCQVCGKPVSTRNGTLAVFQKELFQYKLDCDDWERRYGNFESEGRHTWSNENLHKPPPVKWTWGHTKCLSGLKYFEIEYSCFDSASKALSWTIELMKKDWFKYTNWTTAVQAHHHLPDTGRMVEPGSSRYRFN